MPFAILRMAFFIFWLNIRQKQHSLEDAVFYIHGLSCHKERRIYMKESYQDNFSATFNTIELMIEYHERQSKNTNWERTEINNLEVAALNKEASLYGDLSQFAPDVTIKAIEDTSENIGLALRQKGRLFYPLRFTAYKSLLDRAKINGSSLPKLSRENLSYVLNSCLNVQNSNALLLIRDEKIAAVHSGDICDYSILEIDQLLNEIQKSIDSRFKGNLFDMGYCDHSVSSASWLFPNQKEDLLDIYCNSLKECGKTSLASKITPGIRFLTSDTGMASAKISALLFGLQHPIHIGSILAVRHRGGSKISDFTSNMSMLFAQFEKSIEKLNSLLSIHLDYPVNAMAAICKKLSVPKKAAVEAISMFEITNGDNPATAHDVFMAMQEIMFIMKTENEPSGKLLALEETMARALTLKWKDYDLPKVVGYNE